PGPSVGLSKLQPQGINQTRRRDFKSHLVGVGDNHDVELVERSSKSRLNHSLRLIDDLWHNIALIPVAVVRQWPELLYERKDASFRRCHVDETVEQVRKVFEGSVRLKLAATPNDPGGLNVHHVHVHERLARRRRLGRNEPIALWVSPPR